MIVAENLRVVLQGRAVLDRVSFQVERGEAVALVGPNGSGKTSALRCLLGLLPFDGRASVGGHDSVREPIAARSLIGYLPQRAAFGDATALETLQFVARVRRIPEAAVLAALRRVGLAKYASVRARTFSGGMQQRLSLAVALLADPPVLLFDEPTASLDRAGQRDFLDLAAELQSEGRTLLLASHRAEEIDRLADRVIELVEGRVVAATRPFALRVVP
ncbi:MAG TPA: ABC transporter ATP-binding protein [Myxococcales bacterium]|nr:ABC transporter ATP-binding protein [Myxococcales bacterium]